MATLNFPDSPTTGDVYTDGNSGFSYEWNGSVWISTDPSTASNIREIDDISGDFDGSETDFTLKVSAVNVEPVNAQQLIISLGGVMQNAGDDFTVSGSTITFTTAPQSGLSFFGTLLGTALSLNTIADGTVIPASLTTTSNYVMNGITLDQGAGIITAFGFQGGSITADLDSTFSGNVSIAGSLTVQGTQTIINVDELNIQDKTIGIGSTNAPSSTSQDGAGAIIYGQTHIDILYDREKASLGISTGVSVTGFVTATRAQVGTGVTINNTGIDAGNAGIVTAGTIAAPSALTLKSSATTTAATIDTSSRLLVGHTANITDYKLQVIGDDGNASLALSRFTNNSASSLLEFNKSRNGSIGSNTVVQDGDTVGLIRFKGADGTDYAQVADIQAAVDGTPGDNDMPGCLIFGTTADGAQYTTERLRITSDGSVLAGNSAVYGSGQVQVFNTSQYLLDLSAWSADANGPTVDFYKSRNATIGSATIVQDGDVVGKLRFLGNDGTNSRTAAQITAEVDGTPGTDDMPGSLKFGTTADGAASATERLKITSGGGFSFNNAELVERVKITAGKLSDNTNINLADGMVHYFSTTETGTSTPNIRIDGSNTLNNAMDTGDVISVTLITTAAAAAYSAALNIDGSSATVEWSGAAAPSAGGASGLDVHAYTIIKTGSGAYKVLGNYTNFD